MSRRLKSVTLAQLDYGDAAGLLSLARGDCRPRVPRARDIVRRRSSRHRQPARSTGWSSSVDCCSIRATWPGWRSPVTRARAAPWWLPEPVFDRSRWTGRGSTSRSVHDGRGDARLVYVTPSHQFPLGVPMSLPRRLALLAWARDARAWVIEDDYDSEFRYGTRPIPCLHGLDVDGRVIYVGSFSKTMFPALRLGFLIVPPDLRDVVLAARRAADIHRRDDGSSSPGRFHDRRTLRAAPASHADRVCRATGGPRTWRRTALPGRVTTPSGHHRTARRCRSGGRRR